MRKTPWQRCETFFRYFHQTLFCLNAGFAVALALILFSQSRYVASHGESLSGRFFPKAIIEIEILAHLHAWQDSLAFDALLSGFTLLFFSVLFLLLHLTRYSRARHIVLNPIAGATALCAVPFAWFSYQAGAGAYLPADPRIWFTVALEVAVVGGALYLTRKIRRPACLSFSSSIMAFGSGLFATVFGAPTFGLALLCISSTAGQ
jgi:hypothetical protein